MTAPEPRDGLVAVLDAHLACSCPTLLDESHAAHVAEQVREWLAGEVAAAEKRGAERALREAAREFGRGAPLPTHGDANANAWRCEALAP